MIGHPVILKCSYIFLFLKFSVEGEHDQGGGGGLGEGQGSRCGLESALSHVGAQHHVRGKVAVIFSNFFKTSTMKNFEKQRGASGSRLGWIHFDSSA